jgi:predicted phosphoribosyltransferase
MEFDRRDSKFRKNRRLPELMGKRGILVDDGLASGFSLLQIFDFKGNFYTEKYRMNLSP